MSNIVFVCNRIECGACGVGDYTCRLALAVHALGHRVGIIALGEDGVVGDAPIASQLGANSVLRLHGNMPLGVRLRQARSWLVEFRPDLISLQFVIFAFHPKGLPFGLAGMLSTLVDGYRLHIMLHEIWVGTAKPVSFKLFLWGRVQRWIILKMLKRLAPYVITVSNDFYYKLLNKEGVVLEVLPLFSNIPVNPSRTSWFFDQLSPVGITVKNRTDFFVIGYFGLVASCIDFHKSIVRAISCAGDKRIVLLGVGRPGAQFSGIAEAIKKRLGEVVVMAHFGAQPAEYISDFLLSIDMGVIPFPICFSGKSSAVAVMRQHGVNLCFSDYTAVLDVGSLTAPSLDVDIAGRIAVFASD